MRIFAILLTIYLVLGALWFPNFAFISLLVLGSIISFVCINLVETGETNYARR